MPGKKNTNYNGMVVDEVTALALQKDASAECLSFTKNQNGTYTVQAKFPEWGRHNGKNFRIRENVNYFMRGLARSCLDENGVFDVEKANNLNNDLSETLTQGGLSEEFVEKCGIPNDRIEDFMAFTRTCSITLDMMRFRFGLEIENLRNFKHNINQTLENPDTESYEYNLVKNSFNDYQNMLSQYTHMANMNPQTETGHMFAAECFDYAGWNVDFVGFNNEYRKNRGLPQISAKRHTIEFMNTLEEKPDENSYRKFNAHACFVLETHIGDDPMIISLEATAPPVGKLMFCPKEVRSGVGLYNNVQELEEFHYSDPMVTVPDIQKFNETKNPGKASENVKKATMSDNFLSIALNEAFEEMKENDKQISAEENERIFEKIDEAVFKEQASAEVISEMADVTVAGQHGNDVDTKRYSAKETLSMYADRYAKSVPNDERLGAILEKIRAYSAMDVSSVKGNYDEEIAAYDEIYADIKGYFNELDEKQIGIIADPEKGIEGYDPELPENRTRYQIAADLFNFFEGQRDGNLAFNKNNPGSETHIDGTSFTITNNNTTKHFIDVSDKPLFPHEPCPNDINQGYLGDCYLLAGLSSLSEIDPQKIKDCIRDNNDGTVTVRFFTQTMDEKTGKSTGFKPIYVTVDKKIPEERGADSCLWAQMIERAYVASGLHLSPTQFVKPVPPMQELAREYDRISKLPPEERPSHSECPWLIDTNGNFHKWSPDYEDIEGGNPVSFLGRLIGEETVEETHILTNIAAQSAKLEPDDAIGYMAGCASLELLGQNASKKDEERSLRNQVYGYATVGHLLYRALRPNEDVPLTDNGTFKENANDLANACSKFGSMLLSTIPNDVELAELSRAEMKTNLAASVNMVKKLIENPDAPDVDPIVQIKYKQFLDYAKKIPDVIPFLKDKFIPAMEKHIDDGANLVALPDPYSGEYSGVMNEAYNTIQENIKNGYPTTAATPGETDRDKVGGIYNRHAYSVLGVTHKTLGGKDLKFVILRNPHGRMGREYYEENGAVKFRENPDAPGGVFEMELGDFCKEFARYGSSCIGKEKESPVAEQNAPKEQKNEPIIQDENNIQNEPVEEQAIQNEQKPDAVKNDAPAEDLFLGEMVSNYGRALSAAMKTFDRTSKDSKEFKSLYSEMETLVTNDYFSTLIGKPLSEVKKNSMISNIGYLCGRYEDHCAADKKFFSSSRRDNRLKQAGILRNLVRALENGYKDPKDYLATALVGKMMKGNPTFNSLSKENKDIQVKTFIDSNQFAYMKKSMSFGDMAELSEKSPKEILSAWRINCDGMMAEEYNKLVKEQNELEKKREERSANRENNRINEQPQNVL